MYLDIDVLFLQFQCQLVGCPFLPLASHHIVKRVERLLKFASAVMSADDYWVSVTSRLFNGLKIRHMQSLDNNVERTVHDGYV